ncbi:MAG: hypothetical protein QGI45_14475, partial [Myxococcota bacterium]|nr:hypothetical protein [Myxococcota bacterium]
GKGIAGIIFEQLLGRSLKAPIADVNAPDYAIHFTAYRHEQLFLEEVGERFLNEHQGDIRGLIKDIIKSPYFRAIAADGNDIMSTGVNASFMLGPETMNTKNKRILGMEWIRDGANGFTSEFKLLYGGINSTTVLTRQRTATALSANVITTMALQLPQQLLDGDKLDDLLPNSWDSSWEDENLENDVEPTDESVRSDIQHVMARLLGEYCDEDAVELEETMALFTEIKESEGAQIAWKAVLSLLLMDYNYTHSDLVLGQDDGVL